MADWLPAGSLPMIGLAAEVGVGSVWLVFVFVD